MNLAAHQPTGIMPYIETIDYEDSIGELRTIYDNLIGSRGKLAEVHKIQSLNPAALLAHMELYKATMFGRSPLKRYQREMMAVVVSSANRCPYCIAHHKEALLFYWKDQERVSRVAGQFDTSGLTEADAALCNLAQNLTLQPANDPELAVEELHLAGLDDRAILDAVQVIAYFNFVYHMVLA